MAEELLPVQPAPILAGYGLHSAAQLADQYGGKEDYEYATKQCIRAVASCSSPVQRVLEVVEKNLDIVSPAVGHEGS